ncbi:MAG: hypothetical protein IJ379_02065 [Lachnospiraceae bacterium]|nr:hypothetical protein [Lachnospiraceae bacterium]
MSVFRAWIPKHVSNRLVSKVMNLLGRIHRTREDKIMENSEHNREILVKQADSPETKRFFTANTYIENQRQWDRIRFGSKYHMAYGGCEIFATYNALLALGEQVSGQDLIELIQWYERNGAVWAGKFGGAPEAAYDYFCSEGYDVKMLFCRDENQVNALGEESDAIIVTVYNNKDDIMSRIHTVCITKDEEGHYWGHNCYKLLNSSKFVSDGPYADLWETIHNMGKSKSALLCAIGIRR